ncbi:uncharacterized protein LOC133791013 [Humulus lupulus]|uniref:uncharacterized protein LOC133791013 n=1 Tax=Humulus lupulus TaxID=3486 RepID=UPI002B4147CF|nr:uncharacterized protein LOC133791013 [Humulus lupulus]
MEELGSVWSLYQEQNINELNHKLHCTKVELESVKMEAKEQMTKSEEYLKNLLDLLKSALKERDEARYQLQKAQLMLSNSQTELPNMFAQLQPESLLLLPAAKANSSITESNSLSETYNHHSHGSSPVESFFDAAVSSPELSNFNMADSSHMGFSIGSVPAPPKIDPGTVVIENLSKGKTLPQKGKLLEAVLNAGPLLQALFLAGPLPKWRNPPPLQPFKIPPVSIKGAGEGASGYNHKPVDNSYVAQKPINSLQYTQSCSASMLNFAGGASSSRLNNSKLLSMSSSYNDQIPIVKRQRLH